MISLVTVGTGTVAPHATRGSPAHYVETGRRADGQTRSSPVRLLMDCGPGTCHRLARCELPWPQLTHVAITHFHPDHYEDLPALIFAMKYGTEPARSAPLAILGPSGLGAKLAALAEAFGPWVLDPGFPLEVTELDQQKAFALADGVRLTAHGVPHTDESLALCVSDGTSRLVYTGDTGPSDALGDWARGCSLLLAECSLPEDRALAMHLTPRQAGALAERAQAKQLVLTHLYPPVERVDILKEVAEEFAGRAAIARDGDRFEC